MKLEDYVAETAGVRLDLFVTEQVSDMSRSEAQRLIVTADGETGVLVNGAVSKSNYKLRVGDRVSVSRPPLILPSAQPEDIALEILFEDSDMIVINKPRGMVVHPAPGSPNGTLVNAVLAHADDLSGIGGALRPGVVHRLDKDTGGLLMMAKNDAAHRNLQAQIQSHTAGRRYLALVWGVPHFAQATVDAPIGRHPVDRKRMAVITDVHLTARKAHTDLTVLETFGGQFALIEARLKTGRTHQIRVHCAYINYPIVGDEVYGGTRKIAVGAFPADRRAAIEKAIAELGGQALHAYELEFDHPRTGERLRFSVELPDVMQRLVETLR